MMMTAIWTTLGLFAWQRPGPTLDLRHGGLRLGSACTTAAGATTARPAPRRGSHACMSDADETVDWREMRARLVAQAAGQETKQGDGFVYESPLIETGTVLLGGTKQDSGFALRQQFFHKCVLLLLEHSEGFTKGIILNRPSALEIDGWRVWCGHGQVDMGPAL